MSSVLSHQVVDLYCPVDNNCEVAEKISQHAGMAARYVDIPVEAQRKAMLDQGMPEWQVTALLDLQAYAGRSPEGIARASADHHESVPRRICRRVSWPGSDGLRRDTVDSINTKTGMTHAEMLAFIRNNNWVSHLTISQGLNHVAHRTVEKGRFAMVILKKETGVFASACEKLLFLISNSALPEEDRSVVDYYIREIEQGLDLSYPLEKSC